MCHLCFETRSQQILAYPQFEDQHPFIHETDASTRGLGAMLAQQQVDGKVHPIAFASCSLNPAEQKYTITELETVGLVWTVKLFRPFILGHRCIAFTAHAACTSLLTANNPSSKLVRWAMSIQELNLDIRHRSGKNNQVAEALSRNPIAVLQVLLFQSVTAGGSSPDNTRTTTSETDSPAGAPESGHLQWQDPRLSPWFAYLEDRLLPTDNQTARWLVFKQDNFQLLDGVLYNISPSAQELWRLAIPECLRMTLMKEHHSGKFAGPV